MHKSMYYVKCVVSSMFQVCGPKRQSTVPVCKFETRCRRRRLPKNSAHTWGTILQRSLLPGTSDREFRIHPCGTISARDKDGRCSAEKKEKFFSSLKTHCWVITVFKRDISLKNFLQWLTLYIYRAFLPPACNSPESFPMITHCSGRVERDCLLPFGSRIPRLSTGLCEWILCWSVALHPSHSLLHPDEFWFAFSPP